MSHPPTPAPLRGRERECAALADLVAGDVRPAVALVHGEAGIGKTTLLRWTEDVAEAHGVPVLAAVGVPTQQHLPFVGLRRLLSSAEGAPGLGIELSALGPSVEQALAAPDASGSGLPRTAMRVLDLLADLSRHSGLLVVLDDLQWLDRPSREVAAFIGRRAGPEAIRIALATRDDVPPVVAQAALAGRWRTVPLDRLDERSAGEVLDQMAAELTPEVRRRVLQEAAGLPLALKELPALDAGSIGSGSGRARPPEMGSLLEATYAGRLQSLPASTQLLVLLAAVDSGDDAGELLRAAHRVIGTGATLDDLGPAVRVGLVEVTGGRIGFTHSLVRSATLEAADPTDLRRAHGAFAATAGTPDRRAWHAAAAADAPDEAVARQLEVTGDRLAATGAVEIAAHAYEEAIRLSEDIARRASRQLRALELLNEVGRTERALELLSSLDTVRLGPAERVRADWLREVLTDHPWTGGERVRAFAEIAQRMHAAGDAARAADLLVSISLRCWWSNLDAGTSRAVAAVADDLAASVGDPAHLVITALADPVDHGAESLDRLDRLALPDLYPHASLLLMLAIAATGVGDHPRAADIFAAAIAEARRQARSTVLAEALVGLAWCEVHLGRLLRAEAAADEGVQLSREMSQPLWEATGELALAAARGMRGDVGAATALADRAERVFLGAGANPMLAQVRAARGVTALASRNPADAFAQLVRVFVENDASYHQHLRTFLVAELAEAAAYSGQRAAARSLVAPLEDLADRSASPILNAGLVSARPLLAEDDDAEELFRAAIDESLASWPVQRARVQLEYGSWLRRRRRVVEAREPLRLAHETFAGLGATPWAERAGHELRAAGDAPVSRKAAAWEHLTSQELQIATLAAEGHTNRQIGDRLLLSHRTVSTHLYRTFPKLGISSRAQLSSALADLVPPSEDDS